MNELEWYKNSYHELCDIVYRISDAFIPGYYVSYPGSGVQCCQVLADEIIKFAPKIKGN